MPKRKEQKFKDDRPVRKSEFDPERECYMDGQGNYTYNTWVQESNGQWKLKPLCTARIGEEGVTSDITIILDDMDCEDDRSNNVIRKHRDKVFDDQLAAYEADSTSEDGDKKIDPWEKASYQAAHQDDILARICPEAVPEDARMARLLELMDTLTEDQRNLIYAHLGEGKYFEEIAKEESVRKGKDISRQAISNRWNRILTILCDGFGVEKPKRRNDKNAAE